MSTTTEADTQKNITGDAEALLKGQAVRFLIVGVLVLLMLIPLAFVRGVVDERQGFYAQVSADIGDAWGHAQSFTGPFLVVPETFRYTGFDKQGNAVERQGSRSRVYLPETLNLNSNISHQYRHRAIYSVPVYQLSTDVSGSFIVPEAEDDHTKILLDQAQLVVGLSHTRFITAMSDLRIGAAGADEILRSFESTSGQNWLASGVHAPLNEPGLKLGQAFNFQFNFGAQGTRTYSFAPLAGATHVSIDSTWPHPSFSGAHLPLAYNIDDSGFDATWSVHKLARRLPPSWIAGGEELDLHQSLATVALYQPTTTYSVIDRGIKYGILFIGLTYLTFVCFELSGAIRFHFVQYAVVGAALVLFYQTLLSLSEHLNFVLAYTLATLSLTGMVAWYVQAMTRRRNLTGWAAAILLALYACLYVLLQLQDYALLVGTSVLIAGLLALMYVTRGLALDDRRGQS